MINTYKKTKKFLKKYERFLVPGMLLIGFLGDFVTFRLINVKTAFLLLSFHLIAVGILIIFINLHDTYRSRESLRIFRYARLVAPYIVQLMFGALLSGALVFYWFSGAFSVSWPFIIVFLVLIASNDLLRHYYLHPVVQIGVYYFVTLSLFSVVLPFVFNSISAWLFILSGVLSLIIISIYSRIFFKLLPDLIEFKSRANTAILSIFIFMNALYFLNIIPPIPLSLRDAGVYHDIQSEGGDYTLLEERKNIFQKIIPGETIHIQTGNSVFVLTSIFAPADLDTTIVHHWEYFDKEEGKWVSKDKLSFLIMGGRDDGYRGFSRKTTLQEGKWRINVETKRGQVLGRVKFKIKYVEELKQLEEVTK
jgi:hypothetical protein